VLPQTPSWILEVLLLREEEGRQGGEREKNREGQLPKQKYWLRPCSRSTTGGLCPWILLGDSIRQMSYF